MKILHGPVNVGNQPWALSRAERRLGTASDLVVRSGTWLNYPADRTLSPDSASLSKIAVRSVLFGLGVPWKYDVLHYYFGQTFLSAGRSFFKMPLLQRMKIILHFEDNFDHIFVKSENNSKVYRFQIASIQLILENERVQHEYQQSFLNQKDVLYFPGVTKIGSIENIPPGMLYHHFKLDNVMMPEGLFIFALPKSVESGEYQYQRGYSATNPIFSRHNIQTLDIKYGGLPFSQRPLNYGIINDHMIGIKQMIDHKRQPPFGLPQDPKATSIKNIENGGENTLFPHIYIKFLNENGDRIIPLRADEKILKTPHDLDVTLTFKTGGATPDVTFYAYIFYSDVIMKLNMSSGQFSTHYKHKQSLY